MAERRPCDGDMFFHESRYVTESGILTTIEGNPDNVKVLKIINIDGEFDDWFRWKDVKRKVHGRDNQLMPDIYGVCTAGDLGRVNRLTLYTYYWGETERRPTFEELLSGNYRAKFRNQDKDDFLPDSPENYRQDNVEWDPPLPSQQLQEVQTEVVDDDHNDNEIDQQFQQLQLQGIEEQTLTAAEGFIIQGVELQREGENTEPRFVVRQINRQHYGAAGN
ncbi:hypothetical protein PHYBOEH_005578 [Phytophthora boehmeriae]|uniref:Uncharacterized protein n=1 Tax=Phytophthora boehmeriae TaxID=109152 RepID=A0A8T1WNX7_9STRA|nr:hypothetical protein PHYBOEH_005578 [Phytophthora boehmeriae]